MENDFAEKINRFEHLQKRLRRPHYEIEEGEFLLLLAWMKDEGYVALPKRKHWRELYQVSNQGLELPIAVKVCLIKPVTDIGQLKPTDKKILEKAVRDGVLVKGKGGPFPVAKTVYARPGFDFKKDREIHIEHLMSLK